MGLAEQETEECAAQTTILSTRPRHKVEQEMDAAAIT